MEEEVETSPQLGALEVDQRQHLFRRRMGQRRTAQEQPDERRNSAEAAQKSEGTIEFCKGEFEAHMWPVSFILRFRVFEQASF